jgi:hypothetical protein
MEWIIVSNLILCLSNIQSVVPMSELERLNVCKAIIMEEKNEITNRGDVVFSTNQTKSI